MQGSEERRSMRELVVLEGKGKVVVEEEEAGVVGEEAEEEEEGSESCIAVI